MSDRRRSGAVLANAAMASTLAARSTDSQKHTRDLSGVVSRAEKQALGWLVHYVPAKVTPNHLTTFGLVGAFLQCVSLIAAHLSPLFYLVAIVGILMNWVGDSLDGTLARHRRIERPQFGFFLDHTSDLLSNSLIFIGLGLSPLMRLDLAMMGLAAYLVVTAYSLINLHVTRTLRLSYCGVGPTELRLVLMLGLVTAVLTPQMLLVPLPFGLGAVGLFDATTTALVIGTAVCLSATAVQAGRVLSAEDRPLRSN